MATATLKKSFPAWCHMADIVRANIYLFVCLNKKKLKFSKSLNLFSKKDRMRKSFFFKSAIVNKNGLILHRKVGGKRARFKRVRFEF